MCRSRRTSRESESGSGRTPDPDRSHSGFLIHTVHRLDLFPGIFTGGQGFHGFVGKLHSFGGRTGQTAQCLNNFDDMFFYPFLSIRWCGTLPDFGHDRIDFSSPGRTPPESFETHPVHPPDQSSSFSHHGRRTPGQCRCRLAEPGGIDIHRASLRIVPPPKASTGRAPASRRA